jgi:transposase
MIGVDPHKASHTAVAIGRDEGELGVVKMRATRSQVTRLLAWAEPFEKRTWAIESAGGLGYLLAQQLVAAGEEVLDVPATLASRIRSLGSDEPTRTTPTMRCRWRWRRCGRRHCDRSSWPTTPRC